MDATVRRPGRLTAFATGFGAGLAALTQFFGALSLPLLAVSWLSGRGRAWRDPASYWILGGAGLALLPYAIYAGCFVGDAIGQWSVHADRDGFLTPVFYLNNLRREPTRFAHLLDLAQPDPLRPDVLNRPVSPWLLVLGTWPVLVWLGYRVWRTARPGDQLLLFSLLVLQGGLALLDATKAPLYEMLLVPSVCVAIAGSAAAALTFFWRSRSVAVRVVACAVAVCLLAVIEVEGLAAYQADRARAVAASNYQELGQHIEASLPPDARVLGPERWWWPLHDHPYLGLRNLWRQWQVAAAAGGPIPRFQDWAARAQAQYVVINDDVRQDITVFPEPLQEQFWAFLATCTVAAGSWSDVTYGEIQVRRIDGERTAVPTCDR
jgi:4-amino-4-deoxy-L-arabinose transferase-like glycosyltransferase